MGKNITNYMVELDPMRSLQVFETWFPAKSPFSPSRRPWKPSMNSATRFSAKRGEQQKMMQEKNKEARHEKTKRRRRFPSLKQEKRRLEDHLQRAAVQNSHPGQRQKSHPATTP